MEKCSYKIKKSDQVMVTKGKERGKTGRVLRLLPESGRVVIEKLNIVKKHQRPTSQQKQGGITEKEAPIAIANVMFICDKCKGPVRVGRKFLDSGKKVRFCKKCGEVVDK